MITLKLFILLCSGILFEHSLCVRSGIFRDGVGFKKLTKVFEERNKNIATSPDSIKWKELPVAVDHFNEFDMRRWNMRYCERVDLFSEGGPIFILIGGEGKQSDDYLKGGLVFDLARETNGAIFATEHRYYGESLPLGPMDIELPPREYYRYLSSRQALADLANFVIYLITQSRFLNSKVVVVGGSYPGNLAAWFRLLYPELADAALASSAPVQAIADFTGYYETVTDDYRRIAGQQCINKIHQNFQIIAQKYQTDVGIDMIKQEYNICRDSDITGLRQYALLSHIIAGYIAGIQQGNYTAIYKFCSDVDHLKHLSTQCYTLNLNEYYDPNAWTYQICTEFGYFLTTNSIKQMFWGKPLEYYYQMCITSFDIEEDEVNRGIKRTNDLYGGKNINVSKVLFVNGENDPWHTLGILESSKDYIAILTPNASHCEDLLAENKVLAEKEKNILKKWIGM